MTWFNTLMGFSELGYHETQRRFRVQDDRPACHAPLDIRFVKF